MNDKPKTRVWLNPDGTWPSWLGVIIRAQTGIQYEQQCAGTGCNQRTVEGYFVPLGGPKLDPTNGKVDPDELRAVFHTGKACSQGNGSTMSKERIENLRKLVGEIPFWVADDNLVNPRSNLTLDDSQLSEIEEAWVPVQTQIGSGILVWDNCD